MNILQCLFPESLTALTRTSEELPLLGLCPSALVFVIVVALPFPVLVSSTGNGSKTLSCLINLFFINALYYLYQISGKRVETTYYSLSKFKFFFLPQITKPEPQIFWFLIWSKVLNPYTIVTSYIWLHVICFLDFFHLDKCAANLPCLGLWYVFCVVLDQSLLSWCEKLLSRWLCKALNLVLSFIFPVWTSHWDPSSFRANPAYLIYRKLLESRGEVFVLSNKMKPPKKTANLCPQSFSPCQLPILFLNFSFFWAIYWGEHCKQTFLCHLAYIM